MNNKLKELFYLAKEKSPYYSSLYKNVEFTDLKNIPVVDQSVFWSMDKLTDNPNGIVFKSGGSTGNPKYSYFTHDEWEKYTEVFGEGLNRNILEDNDKVANLFYGGDLYASFFFIKDSLRALSRKKKITHFPISGQTSVINILDSLNEFKINVLCGVPSSIVILAGEYLKNKEKYKDINISKILYGGEGLYDDQKNYLESVFPGVKLSSIGCASVDGGMIGYSDESCSNGEHRVFEEAGIIEILDLETNEPIVERNMVGKMFLTNLSRSLMPIIRYPSGDLAMWVDDNSLNRKFKLMGRSDEAARLGTLSVYFEDTRNIINGLFSNDSNLLFQMETKHYEMKDELILYVYHDDIIQASELESKILNEFIRSKPSYLELLKKELIHPLRISFGATSNVKRNERTGKIKRIIDSKK